MFTKELFCTVKLVALFAPIAWLAIAAALLSPSLQLSEPALAHQGLAGCIAKPYGGVDRGVACNRYSGYGDHWANWVDGCDRESDGWRVRAWADLNSPIADIPGDWDPNGANAGCANNQMIGARLEGHRICVEVAGCSGWRAHGYP